MNSEIIKRSIEEQLRAYKESREVKGKKKEDEKYDPSELIIKTIEYALNKKIIIDKVTHEHKKNIEDKPLQELIFMLEEKRNSITVFDRTKTNKKLRKLLLYAYLYVFCCDIEVSTEELKKGNDISIHIENVRNSAFKYYEKLSAFAHDYFIHQNVIKAEVEFIEENKFDFAKSLNETVLEIEKLNTLLERDGKESEKLIELGKELFITAAEFHLVVISNENNKEILHKIFKDEFNSNNNFNLEDMFKELILKIFREKLECPEELKEYYKVQLEKENESLIHAEEEIEYLNNFLIFFESFLKNSFEKFLENLEKRKDMTEEDLLKEDIQLIENLEKILESQYKQKIFEITLIYYNLREKYTNIEYQKKGKELIKKICCKGSANSKEVKERCANELKKYYMEELKKVQEKAKKHKNKGVKKTDNGIFSNILKKLFSCSRPEEQVQIRTPLLQPQGPSLTNGSAAIPESISPVISIRELSPTASTVVSARTSPEAPTRKFSTGSNILQRLRETKSNNESEDSTIAFALPNSACVSLLNRDHIRNITSTVEVPVENLISSPLQNIN